MSASLWTELSWLPKAPEDFKDRLRALAEPCDALGQDLQALAGSHLDLNQLHALARALARHQSHQHDLSSLAPVTLGLLSNSTTGLLGPAIAATGLRHGLALKVVEAPFNQIANEASRPDSAIYRSKPTAVLLLLDHHGLPIGTHQTSAAEAEQAIEESIAYTRMIRKQVHDTSGACCILQTVPRPPESLLGSLDYRLPWSSRHLIDGFNRRLAKSLEGSGDILLDVAGLAETVGLATWHDPLYWNLAKLSFSQALAPLYADFLCRVLAAMKGKSRRCLVLDLDNTIWGGAVGDLGLDGIELGQGSSAGESFLDVQRTALRLRELGVVLAVCSKNDEAVARQPFQDHPEMILKLEHLADFQANWNDKASNLQKIAQTLRIGLDSLVLLDDNPVERNLVRQSLPAVAVPELPQDPAMYSRTLLAAGYFEAITITEADRQRAEYYQGNARRAELRRSAPDMENYLRSLNMVVSFSPFDPVDRMRVTQLINKTNQFNLTTRRYDELEVKGFMGDPGSFTLQVRLRDRFGDNGLIGVVICHKDGVQWDIDTWLMSCRVMGRKVEVAVLHELLSQANLAGVQRLVGRFVPSKRNGPVRDHYSNLGFSKLEDQGDGTTTWAFEVEGAEVPEAPMTVERAGLGEARQYRLATLVGQQPETQVDIQRLSKQ
jgi:FkbH-like protein